MTDNIPEPLNAFPVVGETASFRGTYLLHGENGGFEMCCQDVSGHKVRQFCQLEYDDETARPLFARWGGTPPPNFRDLPITRFDVRFRGQVVEQGRFGHFGRSNWRIRVIKFHEVTKPPPHAPLPYFKDPPKPTLLTPLTNWLFTVPDRKRSSWEIMKWWELRRWAFHGIFLGAVGISLFLMQFFLTSTGNLKDGEDVEEPIVIFAFLILLHLAHTASELFELLVNATHSEGSGEVGSFLFKIGFVISLFVILLPSVIWGIIAFVSLLHH